jgi:hypothetical protein
MNEPKKPTHTVGGKIRVAIIKKIMSIIFKQKKKNKKYTTY